MNPMLLPKTKSPLRLPVSTNWSASSLVKLPELRRRSTKETAMQPSTFRIWRQLYKNRSSRKIDSQRLFSRE